jgi:O-antigen ligase
VNSVKLSAAEHRIAMMTTLFGGLLTMALALLQIAAGGDPVFYPYRSSSFGEPSGLFANRNHEALFIAALLPMLGYLIATRARASRSGDAMQFFVFTCLLLAIAFLVVVGSRAGLVAGAIGLVAFILISTLSYNGRDRRSISRVQASAGIGAAVVIGLIIAGAIATGSAKSIQRLAQSDDQSELRYVIWPTIKDALPSFMPTGTGVGTYERVFRIMEPDKILRPTYSNHAHNDWLEVVLTAGAPGVLLLVVATIGFLIAVGRVSARHSGFPRALGWMGLVIIFITAIGSIIDYPLRTPVLSALFSLSCVWIAFSLRSNRNGDQMMSDGSEAFVERVRA